MTVTVRERYDGYNKTWFKEFKRKGLRYYLFILSLKIYKTEYEVYED